MTKDEALSEQFKRHMELWYRFHDTVNVYSARAYERAVKLVYAQLSLEAQDAALQWAVEKGYARPIVEQRNEANPQAFRVYGTFTDAGKRISR